MNNIIIPVVDKEMLEFAENMKKRKDDFVIIGATVSLEKELKKTKKANVVTKIFEDGSKKEEIINSLKEEIEEGKVIVCRKPLSDEEIDKFFASEEDVIICKETRSKFHNFFFKLWQIFMQMLFGFEFFDGDVSVVCFNERLYPVLKNIDNLSYSSRVNKWKKVKVGTVEVSSKPVKKEYNKVKANVNFYSWIFLFLATVASAFVYFYFVRGTFLTGFLYVCAIFIAQVMLLISIAIFYMNLRCGQRVFEKAKQVK